MLQLTMFCFVQAQEPLQGSLLWETTTQMIATAMGLMWLVQLVGSMSELPRMSRCGQVTALELLPVAA